MISRASASERNQRSFTHSSRNLPMKAPRSKRSATACLLGSAAASRGCGSPSVRVADPVVAPEFFHIRIGLNLRLERDHVFVCKSRILHARSLLRKSDSSHLPVVMRPEDSSVRIGGQRRTRLISITCRKSNLSQQRSLSPLFCKQMHRKAGGMETKSSPKPSSKQTHDRNYMWTAHKHNRNYTNVIAFAI
jgi:hypothetical protein